MIATQAIPLTTNNNQRLNCLEINLRDNKAVSANLSQLPPFHFFQIERSLGIFSSKSPATRVSSM